ncbi:MAG: HPr family phosphocarrier protein [Pirellulales bacterium]
MDEVRVTRAVVINTPNGLHARPADLFIRLANRFKSRIDVIKDTIRVDGKSMLEMLTLAAEKGTRIVLEAIGPDAEEAIDALAKLVETDFDENQDKGPQQSADQRGPATSDPSAESP